eukprot:9007927-Lingulodinium_polyedra.AAC.1
MGGGSLPTDVGLCRSLLGATARSLSRQRRCCDGNVADASAARARAPIQGLPSGPFGHAQQETQR